MASYNPNSVAFTGRTASIAIPGKTCGRDNLTVVAARSVPANKGHTLPTPPNSLSPSLPPHIFQGLGKSSLSHAVALDQVESDIDLQETHEVGSPAYEGAGMITPALLAKHHLPDILLNHGPLAIRHVMGYLTTSVPGFSGIPPAKARRLVVGALEGRGSGGEGAGVNGDVKFEKVGWGRWDARKLGQPSRDAQDNAQSKLSPPPSIQSSYSMLSGMPIAVGRERNPQRPHLGFPASSFADSVAFSHDGDRDMDISMLENEADKMSLDGDESCSSSEAPDDEVMGNDEDDITDDEDWATVGAAALRTASYTPSAPFASQDHLSRKIYAGGSLGGHYPGANMAALAASAPMQKWLPQQHQINFGMHNAEQEREAVEALLRLGSV